MLPKGMHIIFELLIQECGVQIHRRSFDDGNTCLMTTSTHSTNVDAVAVLDRYGGNVNALIAERMTRFKAAEYGLTNWRDFWSSWGKILG